jgi:drug/metabolite transporter (DMT)-like permease
MKTEIKSLFELNTAVLLFGLSGVLGKIINLSPVFIVLGRVFFASIFLYLIIKIRKKGLKTEKTIDLLGMLSLGFLLAFHWFTFFASIKISSVSIALITFSTFPVFVVFIEPLIFDMEVEYFNIVLAIITLTGIIIIAGYKQPEASVFYGSVYGVLSGLSFAFLSVFNKLYVKKYSSYTIAFYQDIMATVILLPLFVIVKPFVSISDLSLLFIIGVFCTGIAHTIFINSMKTIKAQVAGIISCLEPVYGIIISVIFLKERFDIKFIIGGILIIGAAITAVLKNMKYKQK